MVAITAHRPVDEPRRPRLVEPVRTPLYGLRRLAALVCCTIVLVLAMSVADAAVGALSAGGDGAARPVAAEPVARATQIVQPGDTLWSIALEVAPDRDPRAVVDDLVELNGSAVIRAGERLVLP